MTESEFTAFYPQFAGFTPAAVMTEYVRQAGARFAAFSPEDAEEARRLYTAHRLTLYARAAPPEDPGAFSRREIAAAGRFRQEVSSRKAGEVSVTYAAGTSAQVSTGLADLPETAFGLQLLALLRMYRAAKYVP